MGRFDEEKAPHAVRKFCPQCRYSLVQLHDFDGTCSRDAPNSEIYGLQNSDHLLGVGLGGLGARVLWSVGKVLWRGKQEHGRRAQIQRLKTDILPADPEARICPHCLHLVLSDE